LAGEIRPVTQSDQRISEASRLGFDQIIDHTRVTIGQALTEAFAKAPARNSGEKPIAK
jgi:DNA repair protein RadA/Sms